MSPRVIAIREEVQGRNDLVAAMNRERFERCGVFVLNIMSAPGSGKTEFVRRTLADIAPWGPSPYTPDDGNYDRAHSSHLDDQRKVRMAAIVGDIATDNDARRLGLTGAEVVQITTGGYCHLDAGMIAEAAAGMDLSGLDVLVIENVGNMVCPATFDLGENLRVALLSVTEGEDKPLKYPTLFKRADVVVINKIDIAEPAGYCRELALENLRRVAPQATIFEVSARTGKGMPEWYTYLRSQVARNRVAYAEVTPPLTSSPGGRS